ncbi:acyl carrier protein [Robiginitalea sp.]|jgi:acyl carrier protein|uniref:acyl carrier protein n=1 Tax=Robiginitalea sp. TaxID=1902411 RepID=UPI003C755FA2
MKNTDSYKELLEIIGPYLPEDIDPGTVDKNSHLINELNINSAHLVDIVLDLEDRYDILLEDEDMQKMQTVGDALEIIGLKTSGKNG